MNVDFAKKTVFFVVCLFVFSVNVLASTNTFARFDRHEPNTPPANWIPAVRPASPPGTTTKPNSIAYFRDDAVAALHNISGATAGETWTAEAIPPKADGTPGGLGKLLFPTVTYSGGCFRWTGMLSPLRCGTSDSIRWFIRSQCKPPGTWTFNLKNNGVVSKTAYVDILPKVNEVAALKKFYEYQANYPNDNYDSICFPKIGNKPVKCSNTAKATAVPYKISVKGCAISSLSMVKRYHHNSLASSSALKENSFLLGRSGFTEDGGVNWRKVPDGFMSFQYDATIWPDSNTAPPNTALLDKRLRQSLCENGPTIVHVKGRDHFVVVTGFDKVKGWEILDPGHINNHSLNMYGGYNGIRLVKGPTSKPLPAVYTNDFIIITAYSPVELLLIDPLGNKIGFDRATGRKVSIADSTYSLRGSYDLNQPDPDPAKEIILHKPVAGAYRLEVIGTGTGTYDLEFDMSDTKGNDLLRKVIYDTPVTPGAVHTYTFNYNSVPGSVINVVGGPPPAGGGNAPPVANAGPNQAVECSAGFANVTLNGAGSSDPNGDPLTYSWSGASFGTATGPKPVVNLPLGTHTITLTVNDGKGGTATATTQVTVQDTTPPVVSAGPNVTIPATGPNGAPFNLQPTVSDACCTVNVVITPQMAVYPVGITPITATATDCAGNTASSTMQLTVQAAGAPPAPPVPPAPNPNPNPAPNPGNGGGQPGAGTNPPPPGAGNGEATGRDAGEVDDETEHAGEDHAKEETKKHGYHRDDTGVESLE